MVNKADQAWTWMVVALLGLATPGREAWTAEPPRQAGPAESLAQAYRDQVRPFLQQHCLACHSGENPKGNLHLDQLAADVAESTAQKQWLTVLKRIQASEMPPQAKPRPDDQEIRAVVEWIRANVDASAAARRAKEGRVV